MKKVKTATNFGTLFLDWMSIVTVFLLFIGVLF